MVARPAGPIIRDLAARLRAYQLPSLSDELVRLIGDAMPDYLSAGSVTAADLRDSCYRNLDQALGELLDDDRDRDDPERTPQYATGRRRAQQRLPLESLLHSYRLGGRVIWQGLVHEAARSRDGADATDLRSLVDEAVVVWDVIDRHSGIAARAYREEQARLQRLAQRRREIVLSALLAGRPLTPAAAAEAGEVLGMPPQGPRFVVISQVSSADLEPIGTPEHVLRSAGFASAWVTRGPRDSGLVALAEPQDADRALTLLAECLPGASAASAVVHGFQDVAEAHRQAALTLDTLPSSYLGVARITDRLPQALLAGTPTVTDLLIDHALRPLLALRPAERDVYLDTVQALVDADGSYSAAARRLFCHRNTVIKRVARIEALTGRRVGRLRDLLELHLAVLAVRMAERAEAPPPDGVHGAHQSSAP